VTRLERPRKPILFQIVLAFIGAGVVGFAGRYVEPRISAYIFLTILIGGFVALFARPALGFCLLLGGWLGFFGVPMVIKNVVQNDLTKQEFASYLDLRLTPNSRTFIQLENNLFWTGVHARIDLPVSEFEVFKKQNHLGLPHIWNESVDLSSVSDEEKVALLDRLKSLESGYNRNFGHQRLNWHWWNPPRFEDAIGYGIQEQFHGPITARGNFLWMMRLVVHKTSRQTISIYIYSADS
jgi:hypothetical protein